MKALIFLAVLIGYVTCGSLFIVTCAKADLFTQTHSNSGNLKTQATTMIKQQHKQAQTIGVKLKTLVSDINLKPKNISNPEQLPVNQSDNAVWFYFTKRSFNMGNIYKAIDLAKQHNLVPVIYYLSNQCGFPNAAAAQQFFYEHGLQYIFTQQYQNIDFQLSCNQNILNKIGDNVYFKFMSDKGLHGSGFLDDFTKVYHDCFLR